MLPSKDPSSSFIALVGILHTNDALEFRPTELRTMYLLYWFGCEELSSNRIRRREVTLLAEDASHSAALSGSTTQRRVGNYRSGCVPETFLTNDEVTVVFFRRRLPLSSFRHRGVFFVNEKRS